ncbi:MULTISPECIES: trans-sulfuration enzyme family protein [Thermus]|jgi:cystathionine beta-lyase/cystathionine gamma-synthase|uniref:O-acetylhomoserine (Thiol)-lyase/O-acetylserine (Thiol)-lyase n=1 Tax=Thermus brockianus TaxID=56956 RepID=A0A1J0LS13_THEBO|nr:PLP-dependent aspartate aminotransferase family protein [Thermus brockianus]APD08812.1 O-acetylhomoserine (thiol)-lyase/O-acetylserine (thiol)-lyase [Thermus brockianus]
MDLSTRAVHGAQAETPANAPALLPIYQSAAWCFRDLDEVDAVYEGRLPGAIYARSGTPNHQALERLLAALHEGEAALATASGMAAFTALFLAYVNPGGRVVASRDLYGTTWGLLKDFARFGVEVVGVEATDLAQVEASLTPGSLLLVETLSNPRLRVADLPALAALARDRGALLVVDNTFATPYHAQPLKQGAHLVVESLTKFLSGHHQVLLGGVVGARDVVEPLRRVAVRAGLVPNPWACWLGVEGVKTLAVRLERASATAWRLARFLQAHPKVRAVHYPGLAHHPDHPVANRVLERGYGAMLSFELPPERAAVNRFLRSLKRVRLVLSLGGVETTLSHPATSSHRFLSEEEREALGLHEGFLRLSVGLEDPEDLEAEFSEALEAL